MPQTLDPQPPTPPSTPKGNGTWRTVQMVLGTALVGAGICIIGVKLLEMLFYTPAMLYTGLFFGGERAANAEAPFIRAVLEGAAMLVATGYGGVLLLCGAMNWRLAKASLWFLGVVAVLAASVALSVWRTAAGGYG